MSFLLKKTNKTQGKSKTKMDKNKLENKWL